MINYYSCKTKQWKEIKNQEELDALLNNGVSLDPIYRIEKGEIRLMGCKNLLEFEDREDIENMWNGKEARKE
jgi:hypothetical protein